jgi:hypothetical protein
MYVPPDFHVQSKVDRDKVDGLLFNLGHGSLYAGEVPPAQVADL